MNRENCELKNNQYEPPLITIAMTQTEPIVRVDAYMMTENIQEESPQTQQITVEQKQSYQESAAIKFEKE